MRKLLGILILNTVIVIGIVATLSAFSFANNSSHNAVEVVECLVTDQGLDPPDYEKDVAACNYALKDLDGDGYNDLELTIQNGYPGYQCSVDMTLHNMSAGNASITGITWDIPAEITLTDNNPYPIPMAADNPTGDDDEAVITFVTTINQSAEQGLTGDDAYKITGTIDIIGEET